MNYQPPISIINREKYHPYHYSNDYVNCHLCCIWIEFFQSLLIQYTQIYKQYPSSRKYDLLELIF